MVSYSHKFKCKVGLFVKNYKFEALHFQTNSSCKDADIAVQENRIFFYHDIRTNIMVISVSFYLKAWELETNLNILTVHILNSGILLRILFLLVEINILNRDTWLFLWFNDHHFCLQRNIQGLKLNSWNSWTV